MKGMWIELGDNALLRAEDIVAVTVQEDCLRVRMRGVAEFDVYGHPSPEAARERYNYIRDNVLGFPPREVPA